MFLLGKQAQIDATRCALAESWAGTRRTVFRQYLPGFQSDGPFLQPRFGPLGGTEGERHMLKEWKVREREREKEVGGVVGGRLRWGE